MSAMPKDKLVYDVGMHQGEDTEFYLSRGCYVIGVEANPELVGPLREKFRAEIASGRLTVVDKAVAREPGKVQFAINRRLAAWGSISPTFIDRNAALGDEVERVEVDAVRFDDILREHGMPYYLKIDIEGMDMLCVEALHGFSERPRYLSIESAVTSGMAETESAFGELALLWALGYRGFKYVDQASLPKLNGTLLDLEGLPVRYQDRFFDSGPFGEETPGEWQTLDVALKQARRLVRYQNTLGYGGRHSHHLPFRVLRRLRRYLKGLRFHSWYDLHARLG
jgi:FkbM family methyltransferase